jgi:hypothetical protein
MGRGKMSVPRLGSAPERALDNRPKDVHLTVAKVLEHPLSKLLLVGKIELDPSETEVAMVVGILQLSRDPIQSLLGDVLEEEAGGLLADQSNVVLQVGVSFSRREGGEME